MNYTGLFYILKIVIVSHVHFLQGPVKCLVIVIFCLLKTSWSAAKFGYIIKVYQITVHFKSSHCKVYGFLHGFSKNINIIYYFLKISYISAKFGSIIMTGRTVVYSKNSHCVFHRFCRYESKFDLNNWSQFHFFKYINYFLMCLLIYI